MAKDPAYPMYAQDFDMDTADWSIEEIGIYVRLLNYEWINGFIPNDLQKIARIARISTRKLQKSWGIISKKFSQDCGVNLHNSRMEKERAKRCKYLKQQQKSGKKGAEIRWGKHSDPIGDPIGDPNGENIASHTHTHIHTQKKEKKKSKRKEGDNNIKGKAHEVLVFLNSITGKNFRQTTEIESRLRDGKSIEDCKQIILNKSKDPWFIQNPQYMHVSTLFRKSNWDKYINYTPNPLQGVVSEKTMRTIENLKDLEFD